MNFYNRGIAKFEKGDNEGAISDYTRAIELDPKYASAYRRRGIAKMLSGASNDALLDLKKGAQLEAGSRESVLKNLDLDDSHAGG